MGVVLKTQFKIVFLFLVPVAVIFGFLFAGDETAHAATIIRPPNNLGLVGYWSFDEGRGTQASDLSGNGNDGTLSGSIPPSWVTGRSKHALNFNAAGGMKRVLSSSIAPITSTLTMSAWIYPTSYPSERSTIMQGISPNSYYLSLASDGSLQTYWYGKSSQGYHSSGASTVSLNKWSHVVAVWSTSGPSVYVDGVLENSFASTGTGVAATIVNIGAESLSRQFNGSIDEVRIYNRALSASEVQSLYANTRSTTVGITPTDRYNSGLVAHWTFDGKHTTATTTQDVAGGNHGTINGATPTRGIIGQAMEFDGVDDYLDLPTGWGLGVDFSEMSGTAWVLTAGSSGVRGLLEGRGSDLHWEINNTAWRVRLSGLNYSAIVAQPPVNEWTHVAYTYNRGTGAFKYFVNGQQVFSSTAESGTSSFFASGNTQIGDSNLGTRRWNGKIDDFRIYNRELSADEVLGLYSATKSSVLGSALGGQTVSDGLIGLWTFDQGSGTQANDSSSQSNHGTLFGGPTWIAGKVGSRALQFDGVDDYVALPTPVEGGTINLRTDMGLVSVRNISLTYEGVEDGWKKYSISGSWDTSSYPYSMAVSNYPFVGGTTYTTSAFIKTNVPEKFDTVFSVGINYVNQPQNKGGVGSSTILPDGSRYLVRRDFEYTATTTQLGYLFSRPVQNATFNPATDFVYIRGGQIEQKSYPTSFVDGTRASSVVTSALWIRPVSTGVWEHVAYNGSQYFKNGVVGTPTAYPLAEQSIGRSVNGLYFEGAIDDVRIYNRVLTEAEITQLYSMGQ